MPVSLAFTRDDVARHLADAQGPWGAAPDPLTGPAPTHVSSVLWHLSSPAERGRLLARSHPPAEADAPDGARTDAALWDVIDSASAAAISPALPLPDAASGMPGRVDTTTIYHPHYRALSDAGGGFWKHDPSSDVRVENHWMTVGTDLDGGTIYRALTDYDVYGPLANNSYDPMAAKSWVQENNDWVALVSRYNPPPSPRQQAERSAVMAGLASAQAALDRLTDQNNQILGSLTSWPRADAGLSTRLPSSNGISLMPDHGRLASFTPGTGSPLLVPADLRTFGRNALGVVFGYGPHDYRVENVVCLKAGNAACSLDVAGPIYLSHIGPGLVLSQPVDKQRDFDLPVMGKIRTEPNPDRLGFTNRTAPDYPDGKAAHLLGPTGEVHRRLVDTGGALVSVTVGTAPNGPAPRPNEWLAGPVWTLVDRQVAARLEQIGYR